MKQINIRRDADDKVTFDTVTIDISENVFFTNLDPKAAHWPCIDRDAEFPDFCDDPIDPFPSDNSSQCPVPQTDPPSTEFRYRCRIKDKDHDLEEGIIKIVT